MKTVFYDRLPAAAMHLRVTVFMDEQGFVDDIDEIDSVAVHAVTYVDERPVATCRFFCGSEDGEWLIGRFCVEKASRGKGIGTCLVQAVTEEVRSRGGRVLRLHSQLHAEPFYAKAGFTAYGDVAYEQDSPHIWMEKAL